MRTFFQLSLFILGCVTTSVASAHGIPMVVDADAGNQLFAATLTNFNADEGTFTPTPTASPVALTTVAGFYPVFGGGIPSGTVLTVDIAGSTAHPAALAYWDGTNVLPSPREMTISRSSFSALLQPEDAFVAGGPLSAYSGLEGGHSSVTLALPLDAPVGLYAVGFRISSPGFETSETFWAIANNGVDPAQFDEGVAAITAAVPEPGAIALCLIGCGALAARRKFLARR